MSILISALVHHGSFVRDILDEPGIMMGMFVPAYDAVASCFVTSVGFSGCLELLQMLMEYGAAYSGHLHPPSTLRAAAFELLQMVLE